jgi:DNA-binding response OmpR family regulator
VNNAASYPDLSIIAIDDDPELLLLIALLLRRIGAPPLTFPSGQDALNHLQTHTPDLILLDLMMPGTNGIDILTWARSTPRLDRVPILILSAKADPASIRCGLSAGADGYITKPYVANSLTERIQSVLRTGRQPTVQATGRGRRIEDM